jgi:hypothetical protein
LVDGEPQRHDEQLIRLKFTPNYTGPIRQGYGLGEELRNRDEPI